MDIDTLGQLVQIGSYIQTAQVKDAIGNLLIGWHGRSDYVANSGCRSIIEELDRGRTKLLLCSTSGKVGLKAYQQLLWLVENEEYATKGGVVLPCISDRVMPGKAAGS